MFERYLLHAKPSRTFRQGLIMQVRYQTLVAKKEVVSQVHREKGKPAGQRSAR